MFHRGLRGAIGLAVVVGALAACSGDDPAPEPTTPTQTGGSSPTETDAGSDGLGDPETTSFTIGVSGFGPSFLPMVVAMEELNANGWNIEIAELAGGDLMVQGVDSGQFQMGAGSMPSVLLAIEQDRPLNLVMDLIKLDWTAYGVAGLDSCESLDGVDYAVHSESSITSILPRYWIEQNCPGTVPNWLLIPGSDNRLVALEAGEIDATTLELGNAIQVDLETDGQFNRIALFADDLPDLIGGAHFVNSDWAQANPNTVAHFLAAMLEVQRSFDDVQTLADAFREHLPEYSEEVVEAIAEVYVAEVMFEPNGGLSDAAVEATLAFYRDSGQTGPDLTVERVADRSYIEAALASLDG